MPSTLLDIGSCKNKILRLFSQSDEIKELLLGDQASAANADSLLFANLFPYLYFDKSQTQEAAFLCVEADIPKLPSATVKNLKITIWAYCHTSFMSCQKAGLEGTRIDMLADLADRLLDGSRDFGIGMLRLESSSYFRPGDLYYGRKLVYTVPEFRTKG